VASVTDQSDISFLEVRDEVSMRMGNFMPAAILFWNGAPAAFLPACQNARGTNTVVVNIKHVTSAVMSDL
jgi:hypothetical protein